MRRTQYGALCAATSSVSREALTQSKPLPTTRAPMLHAWVSKVGLADSRVLNVEKKSLWTHGPISSTSDFAGRHTQGLPQAGMATPERGAKLINVSGGHSQLSLGVQPSHPHLLTADCHC